MRKTLFIALTLSGALLARTTAAGIMADNTTKRARDPFWPLNYAPPAPRTETPDTPERIEPKTETPAKTPLEWDLAEREAGIRPARYSLGTGKDGVAFVLFKGRVRAQGELVTHVWKSVKYTWRIQAIASGAARFERLSAEKQ